MQALLAAVFVIDYRIAVALIGGLFAVVLVVARPVWGVGLLLAARLIGTGATVFFRVGKIGIGPFELVLLTCVAALALQALIRRQELWIAFPWKAPFFAMAAWMGTSLLWSVDRGDGLSDLIPLILVVANTTIILAFIKNTRDFKLMIWFWLGACVLIGVLSLAAASLGIQFGASFQAAEGGGRATGLGQQPNWFAMNLFFVLPTALAMGIAESKRWVRGVAFLSAVFVLLSMLSAGSRGGAYATLIGAGLTALGHRPFRRWFFILTGLALGGLVVLSFTDLFGIARALGRIASGVTINQMYRPWNWQACFEMFLDTSGRGIGAGGYTTLLPQYNYLLSQSLYDYPHGIPWEILAHYGVPGLLIVSWFIVVVVRLSVRTIALAKGTGLELYAWSMPAAMAGYAAWSFVEFTYVEKPFWEWLALYTALTFALEREVGQRAAAQGG